MKIIAHRGNLEGRDPKNENHPQQIRKVLRAGFDVEVDVWWSGQRWFLGHDGPQYKVSSDFLAHPGLWCHAKNLSALIRMITKKNIHCFWHQKDDYAVTSKGFIWAYPRKKVGAFTVEVCLGKGRIKPYESFGVCTDYPIWWHKLMIFQANKRR